MLKTCSKCLVEKDESEFYYRKDAKKFRDQCIECWKYRCSASRLGISFEEAREYYRQPKCMCCNENFISKKDHHLHHVNHKVHGVICHYCNIALEQETPETLHRIEACLGFMSKPRKNLFDRANQQGRSGDGSLPFPPTIRRRIPSNQRQCKFCKRILPFSSFYRQKYVSGKYGYYSACKECHKIYTKTYKFGLTFEQVQVLRSTSHCDCCGLVFTPKNGPYIHHVGNIVLGTMCRVCNIRLEQESDTTKRKLEACAAWIKRQ